MTAHREALDVLERATAAGVSLRVDGELLRFESDRGPVPPAIGAAIAARKAELLELLRIQGATT